MVKKLFSNEEITKKMTSLPEEIATLLYSFEMTSIITKVGEKNGLHIDQLDKLNTETGYVMMGLTDTKDFPAIIMEDLAIDQAKADAVARDISDMLFEKIRGAMGKTSENPTPAAPATNKILAPITPTAPLVPEIAPVVSITKPNIPPAAPVITPTPTKIDPADMMLMQKTVAMPATPTPTSPKASQGTAPKPGDYKADPYREPTI